MSDLYRDLGLTVVPPRAADAGKSFSGARMQALTAARGQDATVWVLARGQQPESA